MTSTEFNGLGRPIWAWQITIPECITRSTKSSPSVTNNSDCPANSETIFHTTPVFSDCKTASLRRKIAIGAKNAIQC